MQRQPGDYTVLPQVHLFCAWWDYGAEGKQHEEAFYTKPCQTTSNYLRCLISIINLKMELVFVP